MDLLEGYPDCEFAQSICSRIRHELRIGNAGELLGEGRRAAINLPKDNIGLAHLQNEVSNCLAAGRIAIHSPLLHPPFVFSPIKTDPKPNGKLRTIHHLYHPWSSHTLVNDSITSESVSMKYE
jgi:hypothetical protein